MTTRPQLTSQDLVPNDQPYGSRQQTLAGMQQAGLPASSTSSAGGSAPIAPGAPPPATAPPAGLPANFDVFAGRTPDPSVAAPAATNADVRRVTMLSHPNPFYRELATRIYGAG